MMNFLIAIILVPLVNAENCGLPNSIEDLQDRQIDRMDGNDHEVEIFFTTAIDLQNQLREVFTKRLSLQTTDASDHTPKTPTPVTAFSATDTTVSPITNATDHTSKTPTPATAFSTTDTTVPPATNATEAIDTSTTEQDLCNITYNGTCYWSYVQDVKDVIFSKAGIICGNGSSVPAYFPNEEVYNRAVEDIRSKIPDGRTRVRVWTGITIDTSNGKATSPKGSTYVKWASYYPQTVESEGMTVADHSNVAININRDASGDGMRNSSPDNKRHGVVCQRSIA